MIFYQLLRPFSYLTIKHPAKRMIDFYFPFFLSLLVALVAYFSRGEVNFWGGGGLVDLLQSLVQNLPGFYIAALAAVSTFGKQTTLDATIPSPTPTIETWYGQSKVSIDLTRRRFLCLLFAHLTALSILISVVSAVMRVSALPSRNFLPGWALDVGFLFSVVLYFFMLFQMFCVTLFGLFYLSDKIHQPDPTEIPSDAE